MSEARPIIGMLLDGDFPPDIRVAKEAKALCGAGFEVHLLCLGGGQLADEEDVDGLRVHRHVVHRSPLTRRIRLVEMIMRFRSSKWEPAIRRFVRENGIDVLHVHDLLLAGAALKVKEQLADLKVVVDLHENYAAGGRISIAYIKGVKGWLLRRLYGRSRWQAYEQRVLNASDQVIAVVDEMKERLTQQHDADANRIHVISNYEDPDFLDMRDHEIEKDPEHFVLSYIGGFSPARGLETVIEGMAMLRDHPIRLQVVGKGTAVVEGVYRRLIEANDLHDSVELLGWQPFSRVPALMRAADVGLVPHARNEQTDHTIPHKLFQYMMIGLPVIVSTARPLARVIGDTDAGEIFEAGSPGSFADAVLRLYQDRSRYEHCCRRGVAATLERELNWPAEGRRLAAVYGRYPWT